MRSQEVAGSEGAVFRVTVDLVQVDAVVTDSKGRHITTLTADDFEVFADGRPQKITNCSFIPTDSASFSSRDAHIAPGIPLRKEQVRRTVALVVDDLGMSFESVNPLRVALKKYVDEQMQPGDLVAVIRTSAGMGSLQQFTADKRLLHSAIDRLRFLPRSTLDFSLIEEQYSIDRAVTERQRRARAESQANLQQLRELDDLRRARLTVGSLGAVGFVVSGLRDLPGRKAVILLSDGFSTLGRNRIIVLDALRRLIDRSNRASVLVYTMDARGLKAPGLDADGQPASIAAIERSLERGRMEEVDSAEGMAYLAYQTGGFFVHNTNNFNQGIDRVLDDLRGYYLLGYRPEEATFEPGKDGPEYHKIVVKLKRKDLVVRYRSGFYGLTDEQARPSLSAPVEQLEAALRSPFGASGVRTKLTTLFLNLPATGTILRNLVHIDGRDLQFLEEPDGMYKAAVGIAAVAHGEEGVAVTRQLANWELRLTNMEYQNALKDGVLYRLDVPVAKPGAYQMRVAVRDSATCKVGGANQFVEVPRVGGGPLALSSISMSKLSMISSSAEDPNALATALKQASNRVFRAGEPFHFMFQVYNPPTERKNRVRELSAQFSILKDGSAIYEGKPQPINTEDQQDPNRFLMSGRFKLSSDLEAGPYILRVAVRVGESAKVEASQWIDFDVVQ